MSISDRLDQIEARRAQANSSLNGRHMLVGKDVPELLAALRAVLDACSTYEKTQAFYRIEMGQREIIRVVRAEIAAALGEETVSDDVNLGTITVSMRLDGDDATVQITLPDGELSNVQLLGMLDLARDEILHPSDDGGS